MNTPAYSFRVVWSDEDEAFVATSPEFEGLSGIGDTRAEAMEEALTALDLLLESYRENGWPLPTPATLTPYSGQFRLRIPAGLHERLANAADIEGMSLNTYIAALLAEQHGRAERSREILEVIDSCLVANARFGELLAPVTSSASGGSTVLPRQSAALMVSSATSGGTPWRH